MSSQPSTVLEYALPPSAASSVGGLLWRILYRGLLIVLGLVIGSGLGFAITPMQTFAAGLYKVPDAGGNLQLAGIQAAQQAQVARMRSPAVLDSVLATLQAQGHSLPSGQPGRDKLLNNLELRVILNSRLIQVVFNSKNDARLCLDAANAFMRDTTVVSNTGPGTILPPMPSFGRRQSKVGMVGGAILGALIATALVVRDCRRSQRLQV